MVRKNIRRRQRGSLHGRGWRLFIDGRVIVIIRLIVRRSGISGRRLFACWCPSINRRKLVV